MDNDFVDCTGCNVTRYEVAVCRIHILEEVPTLFLMRLRILTINPYTATFTTAGLRHQTVLIRTRNSRRMDLQELRVADFCALLVYSRNSRTIADRGSRATTIDLTRAAGCQDDNISREGYDLVGVHILGNDTTANAVLVLDDLDEFPELILLHAALDFPTANLLIKSIQQLLTSRRTGEAGTFILLTTEVTEIEDTFSRTRERYAHAIEHLDELWSSFNHAFYSQLISQEVTAIYGIIEMLINAVVLALRIHAGVDAALCAQRMGAFDRAVREQVNLAAVFADLQRSHEAGKTAAYDNNLIFWFISH